MEISQRQLAVDAGTTQATVNRICNRRRRPSPDLAKRLEAATGVPAMAWLYPDEHHNPYIKGAAKDAA